MASGTSMLDRFHANWGLFSEALRAPRRAQEHLLRELLKRSEETAFGREYGFSSIRSLSEYRQRVPVSTYEEMSDYYERCQSGEPDVLFPGLPIFLARTSGTSGPYKKIPFPGDVYTEYDAFLGPMLSVRETAHPGHLERCVGFFNPYLREHTASGIPVGATSGFVRRWLTDGGLLRLVPGDVYEEVAIESRYYAILFAILGAPVRALMALHPMVLLGFFRKAGEFAEPLADDLERGRIVAGPQAAVALGQALGLDQAPRPEVAQRLRAMMRREGRFAPALMWPQLDVLDVWKGGQAQFYLNELRKQLPDAKIWPMASSSTEGGFLIGLEPSWTGGVPVLTASVLEYLPAGAEPVAENFVDMSEVRDGGLYELILTNRRGTYRYRTGDVFCHVGDYRGVPIMTFSHRAGMCVKIGFETISEAEVTKVMMGLPTSAVARVSHFQLAPKLASPPYYELFVELADRSPESSANGLEPILGELRDMRTDFERGLSTINPAYQHMRMWQFLAPLRLVILRAGELERLQLERMKHNDGGRSNAQMKLPHLRTEPLDENGVDIIRWVD